MACPAVDAERREIIKICKKHRYELNLTNLLTRNELQIAVEKLLYAFFRDEAWSVMAAQMLDAELRDFII